MDCGSLDLAGRVALVTGGGGGIGRAIAICLAAHGADITIVDVVPERCDEVAERIAEHDRAALTFPADVTDTDRVRAAVAATQERFGRLDILVNNAGGVSRRPFADQSERSWRKHIDLNLVSVLAATSAAIPMMVAGGRGGSIINVSSIEGSRAAPGYAVYAACKAGLNNLTRTLAVELSDHGIRVNAIAPDYTVTPGTRGNVTGPVDESKWIQPSPAQQDVIRRRIPLGRPGVDAECGHLAVFLASSMASYITGTIIPIDGGTLGSGGWIRSRDGDWVLPPDIAS
ncbi:MAG: SDR family oxidoreductase [Novosphingobium sp.]|nr:SDR family oxidoreductase [Novosphingobium sp.]